MDGFMTAVSTTYREKGEAPPVAELKSTAPVQTEINSAEEALQVLRSEPDYSSLTRALSFLGRGISQKSTSFNAAVPSPIAAQIAQVLATDIASNYWTLLKEDGLDEPPSKGRRKAASDQQTFLQCLRSIPGINAVLLRLRALTGEAKSEGKDVKRPDIAANLRITLDLLCALLDGHDSPSRIWASTATVTAARSSAQRRPLEHEFLALLGSGRVLSWAAEAQETLIAVDPAAKADSFWVANGAEYCPWLTQSVCWWISHNGASDDARLCSELLAKALRLGYTGKKNIKIYSFGLRANTHRRYGCEATS